MALASTVIKNKFSRFFNINAYRISFYHTSSKSMLTLGKLGKVLYILKPKIFGVLLPDEKKVEISLTYMGIFIIINNVYGR